MVGDFQTQFIPHFMNIFCLDEDPKIAAQYNCDRHTGKIVLEICQMITYIVPDEMLKYAPKTQTGNVRKKAKTHFNHPVSKFVRANSGNLEWVIEHAYSLEDERIWRSFHEKQKHFSMAYLDWFVNNMQHFDIPKGDKTEFAVAINEDCICRQQPEFANESAIGQYRLYYRYDKPFVKWDRRGAPEWFKK